METLSSLVVGLPRALLYHRYGVLWHSFFRELGVQTIVSEPTSKQLLENGTALAIDEACISLKIYFGHVQSLLGKCDYIFVPRISNLGYHRDFCVRFEALYDMTRCIFRETEQKFIAYNLDVLNGSDESHAFMELGQRLGFSQKAAKRAYKAAKKAEHTAWKDAVRQQEECYRAEGLKILIAAHSYVIQDAYMGKTVVDLLKGMGVIPIRADIVDRERARKHSKTISPTCKWEVSRELIGSIAAHKEQADGVILLSAFPCGPDAMVNELLSRKLKDIPLLNLVLDSQSGIAGVETRLESFVDIIRLQKWAFT